MVIVQHLGGASSSGGILLRNYCVTSLRDVIMLTTADR